MSLLVQAMTIKMTFVLTIETIKEIFLNILDLRTKISDTVINLKNLSLYYKTVKSQNKNEVFNLDNTNQVLTKGSNLWAISIFVVLAVLALI